MHKYPEITIYKDKDFSFLWEVFGMIFSVILFPVFFIFFYSIFFRRAGYKNKQELLKYLKKGRIGYEKNGDYYINENLHFPFLFYKKLNSYDYSLMHNHNFVVLDNHLCVAEKILHKKIIAQIKLIQKYQEI